MYWSKYEIETLGKDVMTEEVVRLRRLEKMNEGNLTTRQKNGHKRGKPEEVEELEFRDGKWRLGDEPWYSSMMGLRKLWKV